MSGSRADIFISYAHNDNRGSNWVSAFARQLDFALTRRLGRKPALFLDDQRLAGNETERVFEREAAAARLFVPILSPSFVERRDGQETSWPLRELSAFLTQPGALDRVYPVEFLPLSDARLPAALQQKIRKHRFWQSLPESGPDIEIPIDPIDDQRAFNLRIEELAARLARHLEDLAQTIAPEAGPTAASAAGGPAGEGGQGPDAQRKAVLLGQVTFDLEDEQARLRSYLEQFGFRVLPEDTLPQGGAEFADAFRAAAEESALFIQLLGPHGDRRPKDLPEGYTAHQWDAAREAGLERMLWCRPDLSDDQRAAHRDAGLFQTAELLACGIEEFKAAALRRIEALTRPPPPEAARTGALDQIFIDSDRADLDLARTIATELERRSANVFLPVFDGSPEEIARDLRESLLDCNGIIIVFGSAPPMWVRARLRFASKVGIESPGGSRKRIAVYLHPPRQQDELGVMSPNIVWVDGRSAAPAEALTRALAAGAGGAGA